MTIMQRKPFKKCQMSKVVGSEERLTIHFVLLVDKPILELCNILKVIIANESACTKTMFDGTVGNIGMQFLGQVLIENGCNPTVCVEQEPKNFGPARGSF